MEANSERSWRGHQAEICLLVLLAVACHSHWQLTDLMRFSLYPLPVMIALYAGYRFGPTAGLFVGLASTIPWLIVALISDEAMTILELLFSHTPSKYLCDGPVCVKQFSVQFALLGGLGGWIAGWVTLKIDGRLKVAGSSLSALLPPGERSFLLALFSTVRALALPGMTSGDRIDPDPKSLGKTARKLAGKVKLAPLFVIAPIANLNWSTSAGPWNFEFWPSGTLEIIVIMTAIAAGWRRAVAVMFVAWIGSAVLMFAIVEEFGYELGRFSLSVFGPADLAGLAIAAWWADVIARILRDVEKRNLVFTAFRIEQAETKPVPSKMTGWMPLLALVLIFAGSVIFTVGQFVLYAELILVAPLWILLWQRGDESRRISNLIVFMLLPFCLMAFAWHEESYRLRTLLLDFPDLVLLAALPFVVARLDLMRPGQIRWVWIWVVAALALVDLYLGSHLPNNALLELRAGRLRFDVANWAVTLALIWWVGGLVERSWRKGQRSSS